VGCPLSLLPNLIDAIPPSSSSELLPKSIPRLIRSWAYASHTCMTPRDKV
jgi:hypothetical protein